MGDRSEKLQYGRGTTPYNTEPKPKMMRNIILIVFFVLFSNTKLSKSQIHSSFLNNQNKEGNIKIPITPISNLQSSLAAASSQGTTVAVSVGHEIDPNDNNYETKHCERCVLILSRTPCYQESSNLTRNVAVSSNQVGMTQGSEGSLIPIPYRGAIPLAPTSQVNTKSVPIKSRTLHLLDEKNGPILATTGLESDAQYLVRSTAAFVASKENLYEYSQTGGIGETHGLVRSFISRKLRESVSFEAGRPFGVEMMIVGMNRAFSRKLKGDNKMNPVMGIYTIDASGNWRHWSGGGSCVGRGARIVRSELYRILYGEDDNKKNNINASQAEGETTIDQEKYNKDFFISGKPRDWKQALDAAMMSLLSAMTCEEFENLEQMKRHLQLEDEDAKSTHQIKAQYDAVVIHGNSGKPYFSSTVADTVVKKAYNRCLQQIILGRK